MMNGWFKQQTHRWGLRNLLLALKPSAVRPGKYHLRHPFFIFRHPVLQAEHILCYCLVAKSCLALLQPMDAACQAPLSMRFPRQEYWSGLPFPSQGDLPDPRD